MARLISNGNVGALLEAAGQVEQNAIDYYTSIAAALPDTDAIHTLIRAEQAHLKMLNEFRV